MITTILKIYGDTVPQQPELGTICHRCGESIMPEDRHSKIGSLTTKDNGQIVINWRIFCEGCSVAIRKDLERI